ncbi:transposase [Lewinella sp. IMCC34191]|uniref:transposase n=1 Tax=Lewinella sp. IMCC34191 TaxID=2259172 RepID=UPI000E285C47|nr:transposase [Lewinella sp. IMCC34191]
MQPMATDVANGKIPHDDIRHCPVHINYRLHGSVPSCELERLQKQRQRNLDTIRAKLIGLPPEVYNREFNRYAGQINARYELAVDDLLDGAVSGPLYLQKEDIADLVMQSWLELAQQRKVVVYGVCVMGNHVHAVIEAPPHVDVLKSSKLLQSHKSFTARLANRILSTTGKPFWEKDYFDRRIRQGKFMRVMWYVVNNPVKAGLVKDWEEWPHTYIHPEYLPMFTGRVD